MSVPCQSECSANPQPRCSTQSQSGCSSSIPELEYSRTNVYSIAKSIEQLNVSSTANACTSLLLSPDGGCDATILEHENNRKRTISENTDYSEDHEWTTT